jgi:hypothetical protein
LTSEQPKVNARLQRTIPRLHVADVGKSVACYRDLLGFAVEFEEASFAVVRRDDVSIFIGLSGLTGVKRNLSKVSAGCPVDLYIMLSRPDDVDALHEELIARGADIHEKYVEGPILEDYGMKELSVFDADGCELVFAASVQKMQGG